MRAFLDLPGDKKCPNPTLPALGAVQAVFDGTTLASWLLARGSHVGSCLKKYPVSTHSEWSVHFGADVLDEMPA